MLGEQSAKSLRGSKMEDIIFAGTQQRKMLGLAEVTLILDNIDGKLPLEYNEVSVTRRVYRSGESEYYINKSQCRLKDIQELFMDTGIGRDGYSIIGQGKIDEILSNKSEERRNIFEEASGIVKYRTRKDEAVRKLEKTNLNLTRVTDVLNEIESSLGPLEEKSKVAKRYLELREKLKTLEVRDFLNVISTAEEELNKINDVVEGFNQSIRVSETLIDSISKNRDELKMDLEKILLDIEKGQEDYFKTINEIEKVKTRIETFDDRVKQDEEVIERLILEIEENVIKIESLKEDIEKRNTRKQSMIDNKVRFEHELEEKELELEDVTNNMNDEDLKIDGIKNYIEGLKDKLTEYKVEVSSLESTMEANGKRIDTILRENVTDISSADEMRIRQTDEKEKYSKVKKEKIELEQVINDLGEAKARIEEGIMSFKQKDESLKQIIIETKSKLNYLIGLENENEGYSRSVKSVISRAKENGTYGKTVHGTLASLINAKKEHEKAIEIALGGYIQNIVVENDKEAKEAISYLKQNSLGRATFLPINSIKKVKVERVPSKLQGVIGMASELVEFDEKYQNIIDLSLGRTIIVDNMDNGVSISKKISSFMKIVTLDGEVIMGTGTLTGGNVSSKGSSLLGRSAKIELTKEELRKAEKEYSKFNLSIQNDKISYEKIVEEMLQKNEELQRATIEYNVVEEKLNNIEKQVDSIAKVRENKEEEKNELFKQNKFIVEKKIAISESVASIEKEIEEKQQEVSEYARFHKEKEDRVNFLKEDIVNLRISLSSFDESNIAIDEMIEKMKEDIASLELSNNKKNESINESKQLIKARKQENILDEQLIKNQDSSLEELKKYNDTLKDKKTSNLDKQEELNNKYTEEIQKIEILKEQKNKTESKKIKFDLEIDTLKSKIWDDYELTISSAKEYEKNTILDKEISANKIVKLIKETREEIKSLGEISVSSIEEFKEQSERAEFISKQKIDLEETKTKLENLIDNAISIMKTQFIKQFKLISKSFSEVFEELFGGGKAELKLSDESNVLESGIEIEVQPPGKKLQNMMLLSGGERALTAIALLFSILKIKAPPFCILDEIEAALDDINVVRFAKYIKKYSKDTQFIVITHRKGTMEVATSIYGVTMQEYGVSKLISMKLK
ncbi:MAG: chromosome segregation protein SMC [Clostridia bacterium]|nr:chromosome segregation protein SMC [Clostridia bacterium]MDD4375603.1 chromosome segregation protein SMC [Clostridia bacterium]